MIRNWVPDAIPDWVIVVSFGVGMLLAGLWFRRNPREWWLNNWSYETGGTLILPVGGLFFTSAGVGMGTGDSHWLSAVMGVVALSSLLVGIWIIFSGPVPDRFLIEESGIKQRRRVQRENRAALREAKRNLRERRRAGQVPEGRRIRRKKRS